MSIHAVTTTQLIGFTITSALLGAGLIGLGMVFKWSHDLPEVQMDSQTRSCVRVINFANGDAYTCDDVNVILRRYHITEINNTEDDVITLDPEPTQ